jgi:hypothetical protein
MLDQLGDAKNVVDQHECRPELQQCDCHPPGYGTNKLHVSARTSVNLHMGQFLATPADPAPRDINHLLDTR